MNGYKVVKRSYLHGRRDPMTVEEMVAYHSSPSDSQMSTRFTLVQAEYPPPPQCLLTTELAEKALQTMEALRKPDQWITVLDIELRCINEVDIDM